MLPDLRGRVEACRFGCGFLIFRRVSAPWWRARRTLQPFMLIIANAHAVAANGAAPASAQARALRTTTGTATVFGFIVRLRLRTQARRRELRLNAETAVFRVAALASAEEPPAVVGDGLASSVA
jgi:hypothetical protein